MNSPRTKGKKRLSNSMIQPKRDEWDLPNNENNDDEKDSTTQVQRKKKIKIDKDLPEEMGMNFKSNTPPRNNTDRNIDKPLFGEDFEIKSIKVKPKTEPNERLVKTMKKEEEIENLNFNNSIKSNKEESEGNSLKSFITEDKNTSLLKINNNNNQIGQMFKPFDKRRHSAFPSPQGFESIKKVEKIEKNDIDDVDPVKVFELDMSPKRSTINSSNLENRVKIDLKNQIPLRSDTLKSVDSFIKRDKLNTHIVSQTNRENIEDFLEYQVLPKAANLTIGLKKIIMLAKAFLEEPNFIVIEENAIDFDELDNSYFFNLIKVKYII